MRRIPLAAVAAILYCAWAGQALFRYWIHSAPKDILVWAAAGIWCATYLAAYMRWGGKTLFWMSGLAIVVSILGTAGELRVLTYTGWLLAVLALLPNGWVQLVLFLGSFAWMPGTAFVISKINPSYLLTARLGTALLTAALVIWLQRNEKGTACGSH